MDKNLEQFMAIADAGSYLAASERLSISQPALSYNLKKLETKLGVQLFERSSRGVRLTTSGETLYESAVMMQRLYNNAIDTIGRQVAEQQEGIRIGTGYSTWHLLLNDLVVDHFREHPNAPINVCLGNALRCMDQLLAGDISLFLGHRIENLSQESSVHFIPIGETSDSYYVRADHPLLEKPRSRAEVQKYPSVQATPREARQMRLVNGEPVPHSVASLENMTHAFTSNSLYVCLDFLRETDGVLIHSQLLGSLLDGRGIQRVEMLEHEVFPTSIMGIYVHKEKHGDPKIRSLIDMLLANRERILGREKSQ